MRSSSPPKMHFKHTEAKVNPLEEAQDDAQMEVSRDGLVAVGAAPSDRARKYEAMVQSQDGSQANIGVLSEGQLETAKRIFAEFDTDGSGLVDASEFCQMLKKMGKDATVDEARNMMRRADRDDSGKLTLDEFVLLCMPALRASSGDVGAAAESALGQGLELVRDIEKVRRVLAKHRYTIHPSGKYMTYWDPITTLSLLFVAIVTPAEIAFTINEDVDPTTFLFWVNRFIDLVFLKDM